MLRNRKVFLLVMFVVCLMVCGILTYLGAYLRHSYWGNPGGYGIWAAVQQYWWMWLQQTILCWLTVAILTNARVQSFIRDDKWKA